MVVRGPGRRQAPNIKRLSVPDPLLQQLREALGHLPDRLTSDSLLQFSTNHQIAQALLETSQKHAAEHQWQLSLDEVDLMTLIEELALSEDAPYTALPNVPETLRYLRNRGYTLGVATTDTLTATVAGLKKTGILDYFDYLGAGEESRPKPDSCLAERFCSQCDIDSSELLIVGDGTNDLLFAENAGAHFMGVDAPGESTSVFREAGQRSVGNVGEIVDVFDLPILPT